MLTTLANFPWYKTLYVCMKKMLEWVGNIQVWLLQIIIKARILEGIRYIYQPVCLFVCAWFFLYLVINLEKYLYAPSSCLLLLWLWSNKSNIESPYFCSPYYFLPFLFLSLPYSLFFSLLIFLISAHLLPFCYQCCRLEEWWVSGPPEQKTGGVLRLYCR